MQRKLRDRLFFLAFWLLAPAICYWVGARYSFAAVGKMKACQNCPCKEVTAWQVDGDAANEAHGYRQSPDQKPYSWTAISTAQVGISTIPNTCTNQTGDVETQNPPAGTIYASFQYSNAAIVCTAGLPPQEMSVSDSGALQSNVISVNVCTSP